MDQLSMFGTIEQEKKLESEETRMKREQMQNMIVLLNQASRAYYQEAREIMPNKEYDALYDQLVALEKETGIIMSNSPTQNVGYEVLSELPKEKHPSKMLSLDKTKSVDDLAAFAGEQEAVMSWKLDGLTIVLTYDEGELKKAVTRGNGEIGEVVTNNAKCFTNVPTKIKFDGELVLRGEAVITYPDFEHINATITDESSKYKNPRNLCSGSVRQLDPRITKERHVRFNAFALVSAEGKEFKTRTEQFDWLADLGFDVVEHKIVTRETIPDTVKWFSEAIEDNITPSDGLVLSYNDIAYGKSLGITAKFPKDSIAFKWQDEVAKTTLREIEWSASRTGLINPVAIFDPVELEGTTVSRASVHNISVMRELELGIGDEILVYKANMIIPQISDNLTKSNKLEIPKVCPVCGGDTVVHDENGVKTLICPNPECPAKQIMGFTHFVTRDAMNIDGLSEMTIEKLVDMGLIKELADIFHIADYKEKIVEMEGFGEKSFDNLFNSVEKARNTTPERLLYSLGIPEFGKQNARIIAKFAKNNWNKIRNLTYDELITIDGVGDVMANNYISFFKDEKKAKIVDDLLAEVKLDESFIEGGSGFDGLTFVITGSLNGYPNRDALKDAIEAQGGKVAGSVSAKTSYLINNDITSQSGKNKTAKELGVPIIDEETITKWLEEGIS